ncbi:MAG: carboxymuconolactone decarboxylase family protein [Chloroflexi bacterium]|nr:carboxymuconolactone decarboxylase family protein [Chloroflexota bacterium]
MTKEEVLKEMQVTYGLVPKFFEEFPEDIIVPQWELIKELFARETTIPAKYKELISLGIAIGLRSWYMVFQSTEFAKVFGASEEELREVRLIAQSITGWAVYLQSLQYDVGLFSREMLGMVEYAKSQMALEERKAA